MTQEQFQSLMQPIMDAIRGRPLDQALAEDLNRDFPADGETFRAIDAACRAAIEAGWMCPHGEGRLRFGRVVKPSPESHDLSIDVVRISNLAGPHHSHPMGEVCLTMPLTDGALFDGAGAGWCVNEPGSAHSPTVSGGDAMVLYLLPGGQIQFTKVE